MTNAEARFNKSLRPRKPEGSLGRTAQDVHLDSHTAPELNNTKLEQTIRAHELCESRGGRSWLPVPNNPYGLRGLTAALNLNKRTRCFLHLFVSSSMNKKCFLRSLPS